MAAGKWDIKNEPLSIPEAFPRTDEIHNPLVRSGPPPQGRGLRSETEPRPLCPSTTQEPRLLPDRVVTHSFLGTVLACEFDPTVS